MTTECPTCSKVFLRENAMRNHHTTIHGVSLSYITIECDYCSKEFERRKCHVDESPMNFCSEGCRDAWQSENWAGEEHPCWRGRMEDVGSNWERQREEAMCRDNFQCQKCGIDNEEHIEKYEMELHVHHITPRREFRTDSGLNYEEANKLENLITLCATHHRQIESGTLVL